MTSPSNFPPNSLPNHIIIRQSLNAGRCLFTSRDIAPGELVFRIDQPLVLALDAPRLRDTCAQCLHWMTNGYDDGGEFVTADGQIQKLRDCLGCKVVRYCGKSCQLKAWNAHHKYECKIFKSLYPNVLPNTARLLMQLLLRRKAGSSLEGEGEGVQWREFFALQSHLDEFKAQTTTTTTTTAKTKTPKNNGHNTTTTTTTTTTWEAIELMSVAALNYSRSHEPVALVQSMAARVLLNTLTLTAPSLDPLGVCLSPTAALLNHSCAPNTAITFDRHGTLSVRSLASIPSGSPLSISYIDATLPTPLRRAELISRYHFSCTCPLCLADCTSSLSNPDLNISTPSSQALESESARLIATAASSSSSSSSSSSLQTLQAANTLFIPHGTHYPPHRHPRPTIHQEILLSALTHSNWPLALRHSLVFYFHIDPILYPQRWHPVRVVHTWVTVRLAIMQMADPPMDEGEGRKEGKGKGRREETEWQRTTINWTVVVWRLWREVTEDVIKSHGADSTFATEVRAFGERNALMGLVEMPGGEVERTWALLRGVAEEVLR